MNSNSKYFKKEYIHRINRVIDFIEMNIEEELTLEKLSGVANFSPFHFHRIFTALVGESLNQFIQRIRIEKAAMKLLQYPDLPITRIAYDMGFSSSSAFARSFKNIFKISASHWRDQHLNKDGNIVDNSKNCKVDSKMGETKSKPCKDSVTSSMYDMNISNAWRKNMQKSEENNFNLDYSVEIKNFTEETVAYVRHIGTYKGDTNLFQRLFQKLFKWAGPRDLLNFPETRVMSIYHDNPEITDEDQLRTSLCITVPEDTDVDGDIGKMKVAGGKYAVARFEIDVDQYPAAWNSIYASWLPDSGYQPDDNPPLEVYLNDPETHPEGKHHIEICIPVKPFQ